MQYRVQKHMEAVDWESVCRVIGEAGLRARPPEVTRKAFENSYQVVFVFAEDQLIGVGRAVSDGVYEAALYDIAVLPQYQGKKLGRLMLEELHKGLEGMNVILYASPGKETFYAKFGYRRLRTGMARFIYAAELQKRGFTE